MEGGEGTQDDLTLGFLPMSPKTINAITGYSRQMLLQGNPSVDAMVLNDLAISLAQGIDAGALNGTGADGQPTGILNTTGIGAVDMADGLTFAKAVELETNVYALNAKGLNYVVNATTAGLAKTTPKVDGQPIYIMENNQINGYDVEITNALGANTMIFGDFSQVVTGLWGGLDIITERNSKTGGYTISAFQSVDIGTRHAQSFSATTNIGQA
jgi:HK97 family phage major capsid protein